MANESLIFNTKNHYLHHQRSLQSLDYQEYNFLFRLASQNLIDRLQDITYTFDNILNLSPRKGEILNILEAYNLLSQRKNYINAHKVISESVYSRPNNGTKLIYDEQNLPFKKESFDLILSCFDLHWINNIPLFLLQVRQCLKADGAFLAAFLGGDTLKELRNAFYLAEESLNIGHSAHISPMISLKDSAQLMQNVGFSLPVSDRETMTLKYKNSYDLMKDLRGMGETNCWTSMQKSFSSRKLFEEVDKIYKQKYGDKQGYISATFEIIYLIGWEPHSSQQKPLKPGSGKISLDHFLQKK